MFDALAVLYLGVVQIGVAYTLFTLGMARGIRSLDAGIVGYIEPVLNPIWVFLVLGERPSKWALIGGAIIISAVVVHTTLKAKEGRRLIAELRSQGLAFEDLADSQAKVRQYHGDTCLTFCKHDACSKRLPSLIPNFDRF